METLPLFVQNGRATVFGKTTQPVHWVAVNDYVTMVVSSYQQSATLNQRIMCYGPEGTDIGTALERYSAVNPQITFSRLPYWLGRLIARVTKNEVLNDAVALLRYYETVGEGILEKAPAQTVFGTPQMRLHQWLEKQNLG